MPTKPLFFVAFLFIQTVYAQQITILDADTNEPVSDVAIYNKKKNKSAISDFDGKVSIDRFKEDEIIYFQHTSYAFVSFHKSEILKNDKIVQLKFTADDLDEIVISVTKFKQAKREIPQSIVSITAEEAQLYSPQTSADLLGNSGKVFVQKSQLGGGSPMIRGFSTNRLLMTVDGVRMNTAIFRGGNIQNIISLDPFLVESTEVIMGPGAIVYGSDAVGGVMSFYTLQPKFSFQNNAFFSGSALTRYATASEEKTGHIDFNIGLKKWAFLTSVSYNDFGDLKMGKHGPDDYLRISYVTTINGQDTEVQNNNPQKQVPTGYNQLSIAQKIRFMPKVDWDLGASFIYSETSNYARYDRLTQTRDGNLRSAEWDYGPQRWLSGSLYAEKESKALFYDKLKIIAAYQYFEESRIERNVNSNSRYSTEDLVDAYSLNVDFSKKINTLSINYGLEYVYNQVHSSGTVTDTETNEVEETPSRYPHGATWQSIAAFTGIQYAVSQKVNFLGGLRYSHFKIAAVFDDYFFDFPFEKADISTGNLTGSLGLTWQPNAVLGWRAVFSTAFRSPNIDDIGKIFDSEPGSVVVPNPHLKAEYAYTGEVGVTFNFDDFVKVDAGAFYTKLDDALVRRDFNLDGQTQIEYQGETSNVQAIQNAADARVYGFETSLEVNFSKQLQLRSNYTLAQGYETLEGGAEVPLRHAPPQFGNTHLVWKGKRLKIDAFANYSGQIRAGNLAPSETAKPEIYPANSRGDLYSPGWYTLNLATQYQMTEAWQLSASLENISDQRYRTYSSGIAAPGRNFIASVKYRF